MSLAVGRNIAAGAGVSPAVAATPYMSAFMSCLNCGASTTIRAHLMPQCLAREVQVGLSHAVGVQPNGTFHQTQSGTFDPDILCQTCDNQLGVLEQRAASALQGIRAAAVEQPLGGVVSVQANTQQMLRFYAGLLWKYGVTKPKFGRIRLGPYLSRIQQIAFGEAPIPAYFDAVTLSLARSRR